MYGIGQQSFLRYKTNQQTNNRIIDKLDQAKSKSFWSANMIKNDKKKNLQIWKICKIIYPIKELYLDYVKCSYNVIMNK